MNHTTKAERERLLAAAREHVALDGDGEIVGGFDAAWRSFQAQHDISDARARRIVSTAARQLRGEMIREPGPPRIARPSPQLGLERIKPVVEKINSHLGCRLRRIGLRGSARHGVVSSPAR